MVRQSSVLEWQSYLHLLFNKINQNCKIVIVLVYVTYRSLLKEYSLSTHLQASYAISSSSRRYRLSWVLVVDTKIIFDNPLYPILTIKTLLGWKRCYPLYTIVSIKYCETLLSNFPDH